MKFIKVNTKEPQASCYYGEMLDRLGQECEIKVCEVGESMVFTTKIHTITTSEVISVEQVKGLLVVETKNSFYMFEE